MNNSFSQKNDASLEIFWIFSFSIRKLRQNCGGISKLAKKDAFKKHYMHCILAFRLTYYVRKKSINCQRKKRTLKTTTFERMDEIRSFERRILAYDFLTFVIKNYIQVSFLQSSFFYFLILSKVGFVFDKKAKKHNHSPFW